MKIAVIINGCSALLNKQIEELNSFVHRFLDGENEIEAWILVNGEINKEGIKLIRKINYVKFIKTKTSYLAEDHLDVLQKLYEISEPDLIIFGSGLFGSELSVRLAYRLGGSSCVGVKACNEKEGGFLVEKLVYANNLTAKLSMKKRPYCISITKGFKDKVKTLEELPKFIELDYNAKASYPWVKSCEIKLNDKEEGLTSSNIVVAVGRGIGNKENINEIEELAKLMDGEFGASRPVVMSAWTGMNKLIGASGAIISPEVCVAIGVSGAAAFLVGIDKSKLIVAINNDERAPIFKSADVAIVDDYKEVLDELIQLLKKE